MGAPGFWDDQQSAAQVSAEHSRTTRRLERWRGLASEVEDLQALAEMAEEDESVAAEVAGQMTGVEERLAELEEERLFSGRYDAGDALVTVNAGAGGTDAQDWAEMVLRMMMRWAERRGLQVELLEASPGEEAGIKSATFRATGENAYGLFSAEKGVHRLVRLSPFDAAHRRQTSFAGARGRAGGRGRRRHRDRGRRPADRHLPRLGRRRPARQQDRLGRAHHPPPERDRRAVPERALAVGQQGHRDEDAAGQAAGARGGQAPRGDRRRARRGPGRQLRLADPLLRPAPVHDGQGPPHLLRGRATPSACSTATSTASSAPSSCAPPATNDRAAGRALPRRGDRLRDPRSRALPRPRPQGRPGRRPRAALRPRRPRAVARHPAGHLGRRPRALADALRGGRAPRGRGPRRRAHVVPDQRRDAGQPRAVPGAGAARHAGRGPAQLARLAGRRARALGRRARLRAARVRRRARHGPRRRAGARWARARGDARRAGGVHRLAHLLRDGGRRRRLRRGRPRRRRAAGRRPVLGPALRLPRGAAAQRAARRAPTRCSRARTRSRAR